MTITEVLKQYFGYDSLRGGQEELITSLLDGTDVLGIMPTGAGKSLCYQIPALMLHGITLVVSPLISLMSDQVKALNQMGIHAAYINSSLTEGQISKALQLASQGVYKIIYVAPERLLTNRFLNFAMNQEISLLAVDEAHCISQWGQDFRPSYRDIRTFADMLPTRPRIGAYTATATEQVKNDIQASLALQDPKVVVSGFDRPNLYFRVAHRKGGMATDNAVLHYVLQHSDETGIIYCATKKNVDQLYQHLLAQGISAARYHAGMTNEERKNSQDDFTYDRISVMVATNAFGMGIDKSNVRYVLHYNMPQSLEYYYQEAGRAGRDGEAAECVLFYSKQDIMINKYLLQRKEGAENLTEQELRQLRANDNQKLQKMIDYCETDQCLRQYILEYFGEEAPDDCGNCSNCVPVVEEEETNLVGKKKDVRKSYLGGSLSQEQQELFETLREVRRQLASREKVPPYLICSDKTLADMCVKLPENEQTMLKVYGMGLRKAEEYGRDFIEEIVIFVKKNPQLAAIPEGQMEFTDQLGYSFGGDRDTKSDVTPVEEAGRTKAKAKKKAKKRFFHMEPEQWQQFTFADKMKVKDIALQLNEIKGDNGTSNISAIQINQILVEQGYLENREAEGGAQKRVTEQGFEVGMQEEERKDRTGRVYYAIIHSRKAQEKILEILQSAGTGTSD